MRLIRPARLSEVVVFLEYSENGARYASYTASIVSSGAIADGPTPLTAWRDDMHSRHICVPANSPAWHHYLAEGWIPLHTSGTWVFMTHP
jgi:hypothetical protein